MSRPLFALLAGCTTLALAAPSLAQQAQGGAGVSAQTPAGGASASGSADTSAGATTTTTTTTSSTTDGPMTSDQAVAQANDVAPLNQPNAQQVLSDPALLLNRRGVAEYSVGWRIWVMHVPRFIVGLFATIENGIEGPWGGGTGVATGPEFIYRNNGLDIAISAMYVNYGASPAYFRGLNEGPIATERVQSNLFAVYLTSHFLWGVRFHRMFELQIGAGIGLGYVGGDLFRSQAFRDAANMNLWRDCNTPGQGAECGTDNNHYTRGGPPNAYTEPSIFNGGYVPTIMPWLSIPHVAFHVRPHRNFDFKLEGGFGLIGFYGGASLHYVF